MQHYSLNNSIETHLHLFNLAFYFIYILKYLMIKSLIFISAFLMLFSALPSPLEKVLVLYDNGAIFSTHSVFLNELESIKGIYQNNTKWSSSLCSPTKFNLRNLTSIYTTTWLFSEDKRRYPRHSKLMTSQISTIPEEILSSSLIWTPTSTSEPSTISSASTSSSPEPRFSMDSQINK